MKKLGLIIVAFVMLISCEDKIEKTTGWELNGVIHNAPDSAIVYLMMDEKIIDSTLITSEKFRFSGIVNEPTEAVIRIKDSRGFKSFWLENNLISFVGELENLRESEISGSTTQTESNLLSKKIHPLLRLEDSLLILMRQDDISEHSSDSLNSIYMDVFKKEDEIYQSFIKEYPNSIVSQNNLNIMKKTYGRKITYDLFQLMNEQSKQSKYGKSIARFLALNKNPKVGDKYEDIEQKNVDGKKIKLSDIKGKYILLEFWASWCGPCRGETPNLVKQYKKYKNDGFEIFGVSNDVDKNEWTAVISKDSMTWINVSALKNGEDDANFIYGINGIPANFLIDKNGIIIAENLRGIVLEQKLKEIFGK